MRQEVFKWRASRMCSRYSSGVREAWIQRILKNFWWNHENTSITEVSTRYLVQKFCLVSRKLTRLRPDLQKLSVTTHEISVNDLTQNVSSSTNHRAASVDSTRQSVKKAILRWNCMICYNLSLTDWHSLTGLQIGLPTKSFLKIKDTWIQ